MGARTVVEAVAIAKKVAAYTQEHPDNKIIKMGIGDVTPRISMLYLDHATDPKRLKEMAARQFAILDRGIRD